ncbi:MAG: radical SAM family heme chaperone HemW [Anaerolineae bacterium]
MVNQLASLSLYLHIPFCRRRCSYCDFNTYTSLGDLKESYAEALCLEVAQVGSQTELAANARPLVHTIYFGGGTPSLMPAQSLAQIFSAIRAYFAIAPDAEISLEANPGTVDAGYLAALRELGVNRLSFGAQSAIPSELNLLEREHDFTAVVGAVTMARAAGFEDVNVDLIYGVPGQTIASWEQSLRATLALEPTHLSLYCLTIEQGTPMHRWLHSGRLSAPDPDLAADQYELACRIMAEQGYEHYEISNWALPGYPCRHNLTYWRNQSYLGLGAGAHGHAGGFRYQVVKQPRVYIRRMQQKRAGPFPITAAAAAFHVVERQEAMSDTVITQLRLLQEGLGLEAFAQAFGQSIDEAYPALVGQLVEWGLLCMENGRLRLTQKGCFLSNQVFYRFM